MCRPPCLTPCVPTLWCGRPCPLALGDSVQGFRVVGTDPGYLDLYGARLARGQAWQQPCEAVLGAEVARRTGLDVGPSLRVRMAWVRAGPTMTSITTRWLACWHPPAV